MMQPALFVQPITLSELESHLWEAANILRGSPVDRTGWKSYILPLLFFKRICAVRARSHRAGGRSGASASVRCCFLAAAWGWNSAITVRTSPAR
jgi:hypothetical protein